LSKDQPAAGIDNINERLEGGGGSETGGGQQSYKASSQRAAEVGRPRAAIGNEGPLPDAGSRKVTPETELPRLIGTKSQVGNSAAKIIYSEVDTR
jgi:hypothetical protein